MADRAVAIDGGPVVAAYTVQAADAGEGLTGVAQRLYGDTDRWAELYAVNRGVVGESPGLLKAGQRLIVLP